MALREAQISDAQARSVQGAGIYGVLRDNAVTTTKTFFDLTAWEGRMVAIAITGAANWRFAQATGDTLDIATEDLDASNGGTAAGAALWPVAGEYHRAVPLRNPKTADLKVGLLIAAVAGTIDITIHPA